MQSSSDILHERREFFPPEILVPGKNFFDPIQAFVESTICSVAAKETQFPDFVTKVRPQSPIGSVIISLRIRVVGFKWVLEASIPVEKLG